MALSLEWGVLTRCDARSNLTRGTFARAIAYNAQPESIIRSETVFIWCEFIATARTAASIALVIAAPCATMLSPAERSYAVIFRELGVKDGHATLRCARCQNAMMGFPYIWWPAF